MNQQDFHGNLKPAISSLRLKIGEEPSITLWSAAGSRKRGRRLVRRSMKTRAEIDQKCWAILAARTPFAGKPEGFMHSGHPANFRELADAEESYGDYGHAWSEFLHEFYRYKTVDFLAVEPPAQFSPGRRALLAGVADALSIRFGLPVPEWTQRPEYTLAEPWDPSAELYPGMPVEERISYASPVFQKRNVVFRERSLIVL